MSYDYPVFLLFLAIPFVALGQRFGLPYPLVLVVGGLLLSVVPGGPDVKLEPEVVVFVILPLLLFWEAYAAPIGEMRDNAGWVLTLSVTLVLITVAAVALCVRMLEPGFPLAVAVMLGAIVSPTDNVAFSSVADRMGLPRRLKAIVQGESLFNDAIALVLYAAALNAALDGTFSAGGDIGLLFKTAFFSIGYGVAVGWVAALLLSKLRATELQTAILVLVPFLSFLPAFHFDLSGVLAVVTTGIVISTQSSRVMTYVARLRYNGFSQTGAFLINTILFLMIGLQLRVLGDDPARRPPARLLYDAIILNLVIFGVRFVWVYGRGLVLRLLGKPIDPRYLAVVAWSGMRGSISLAAAIAVPYAVVSGAPFPDRHFVLYMTFSVIVVTLVLQGLTLGPLVRSLRLVVTGTDEEDILALREIGNRALLEIDALEADGLQSEIADTLRRRFDRFSSAFGDEIAQSRESVEREAAIRSATIKVIASQRRALDELSRTRRIDNSTQKRIERLLDLQEAESTQIGVALAPRLGELHAIEEAKAAS